MEASPFVTAFAAVFVAEIVGDRSLFTLSSLASRFGPARVALGAFAAFAMKMGAAVLVGHQLASLPPPLIAAVSAATFFATAALILRRAAVPTPEEPERSGATISFAAIFLTEWADIGQITAAMLVARFGAPLQVWCGATAAMMLKGTIALALAAGLRNYLRSDWLRYGACATCIVLGILAAFRID